MAKLKNKLTGTEVEVDDSRAEDLLTRHGYSGDLAYEESEEEAKSDNVVGDQGAGENK